MRYVTVLLAMSLMFTGCTTLKVTKVKEGVNDNVEGVRYSLPKPFILVKPEIKGDENGKPTEYFSVTQVMLPDSENTYAVEAHTFLAKHKLDVQVSNGLLTEVTWNPTTSDVVGNGLDLATTVGAALIRKNAAENAANATADAASRQKWSQAVQKYLTVVVNPASNEAAKKQALFDLLNAFAELNGFPAILPGETPKTETEKVAKSVGDQAWGPMLYSVEETKGCVKLQPVAWPDDLLPPEGKHQKHLNTKDLFHK